MVAGVGCSISKLEFAVTMSNMKVQSIKIPKVLNQIELKEVLQCHSKVVWFEDLEKFKTPGTLTMLATMRPLMIVTTKGSSFRSSNGLVHGYPNA